MLGVLVQIAILEITSIRAHAWNVDAAGEDKYQLMSKFSTLQDGCKGNGEPEFLIPVFTNHYFW